MQQFVYYRKQVDWAKSYIASMEDLQKYVKAYHTTGPSWNKNVSENLCLFIIFHPDDETALNEFPKMPYLKSRVNYYLCKCSH